MTVEEQIQAGIVPGAAADPEAAALAAQPTQLSEQELHEYEAEVIYDWDHLSSGQVRAKRAASADYNAALERVAADDYPGCPVIATLDKASGIYTFDGGSDAPPEEAAPAPAIAPAAEVIATPVEVVAPPAVVPAAAAQDPNSPFIKTSEGYEIRIDLQDGGGVQVFKGRTEAEATRKLAKGQANATREIRRRNREREVLAESIDRSALVRTEAPAPLTADEIFTLNQQLHDPATTVKAYRRLLESQLGMPIDEFRNEWERQRQVGVAKRWVPTAAGFYNDLDGVNAVLIGKYMETHNIEVNEKNLGTVFNVLKSKGVLLEAPEVELPEPIAAPVVAPVVAAPASVVPAATPAAVPEVVPKPAAAPTIAAPAGRQRPGSASTGASPRRSSVRPGVTAGTVVGLTAEEYRKLPTSEVKQRYKSDLAFRAGVDKLISEGKI